MYHVSTVQGLTVLEPRVPHMCDTYGEPATPRVCAAPTIEDCLNGLGDLEWGVKYYVYQIAEQPHLNNSGVIAAGVCDAHLTNEVWYFTPTACTCIGPLYDEDGYRNDW